MEMKKSSIFFSLLTLYKKQRLEMTHQYRRLTIHKPNSDDRLLEDQQEQEQDSTRSFPRWLSTFVVLLFLTNAVTLLGSLYWTSWRELSIKAEAPLDYGKLKTLSPNIVRKEIADNNPYIQNK